MYLLSYSNAPKKKHIQMFRKERRTVIIIEQVDFRFWWNSIVDQHFCLQLGGK